MYETYSGSNGFLYNGSTYSTINDPAGQQTAATGINSSGEITGLYVDSSGNTNGFVYNAGTYTTLDDPLGSETWAWGINDSGEVVGYYYNGSGYLGFLYNGGTYTTINDPLGTESTWAYGINDSGEIAGTIGTNDPYEGFTAVANPTPEPDTGGLLLYAFGFALAAMGFSRRRKSSRR